MFFLFLCVSSSVPYPPLNISRKIVHLSPRAGSGASRLRPEGNQESTQSSRRARDVPLMEEQEENTSEEAAAAFTQVPFIPPQNQSGTAGAVLNQTAETQSDWPDPTEPPPTDTEDEFVNAVVSEYEDSNEPGSAMGLPSDPPVLPTKLPPLLLELRWLPPRPPTSYDGFNVYIYRDGNHAPAGGALETMFERTKKSRS